MFIHRWIRKNIRANTNLVRRDREAKRKEERRHVVAPLFRDYSISFLTEFARDSSSSIFQQYFLLFEYMKM